MHLYLVSRAFRDQDLVAVIQVVLEAGEATCLPQLVPYIPRQSAHALRAIEKILNKRSDIPEPFRRAVNEALAVLPPARGLRGFFHALRTHRQARREPGDEMARQTQDTPVDTP